MLDPAHTTFSSFAGLRLNAPLDRVSGEEAIDLLDVDWDGRVLRARPGAKEFTAEQAANNYGSLFPHSDTRMLARSTLISEAGTSTLVVLEGEGKEIAGKTATVLNNHLAFTRMGTPSASYTYIADRINTLKRYDGTSFTEPKATVDGVGEKAMPKGFYLATWADEGNRLVIAGTAASGGPNGATSSGSHVWFANPGGAEAYQSTAFVQLSPGDGEEIVGCCAWGGMIFVFKETKMFVFYGVSADAEGKPIFNFRTVDFGARLRAPAVQTGEQVVAGVEGVYFITNSGLWVTTGGEPALLSDDLEPLSRSQALIGPAATTFGELRWSWGRGVAFLEDAVYIGLGSISAELLLKLDLHSLRWTAWFADFYSMVPWNEETNRHRMRLFFSGADATDKGIYFYTPAVNTDPTAAMSPRWQSGFYDVDNVDEKTLTNVKIWGTGNVNLKVAEDFGSLGSATEYKLGEGTAIAQRQKQKGQSATLFSHQLSGTAPWSVQRLSRYLQETRVPSTQKP